MVRTGFKQTDVGEIPEDWDTARLGEHGRTYGGLSGKSAVDFGWGAARYVPFLNVITNSLIRLDQLERVQVDSAEGQNSIQNGDLLFNGSSEVPEEVAMGCLVSGASREVFLNSFCFGYRPGPTNPFDGRYLSYLFRSPVGRSVVSTLAQGSTRYNISKTALMRQDLPLPPLSEQQTIARILSDTDELIESLEQLIAKKQLVKQSTMDDLLTGKRRLTGFDTGSGFRQTEVGKIPTDWSLRSFGSLVNLVKAKTGGSGESIRVVELDDIPSGAGKPSTRRMSASQRGTKYLFEEGDVLFARLRAYLRKYWIADSAGGCSTEFWVMRANRGALRPAFLRQLVETRRFIEAASISFGTHMPRSEWSVVSMSAVALPPLPEQQAIAKVLSDMDEDIEVLQQRRDKTTRVKEALMDELLSGRTRV